MLNRVAAMRAVDSPSIEAPNVSTSLFLSHASKVRALWRTTENPLHEAAKMRGGLPPSSGVHTQSLKADPTHKL
jgi:hypothetical protein